MRSIRSDCYRPSFLLRAFRRASFSKKLGLGEAIWRRSLASRGCTWIDFGTVAWKLNLANATHRWLVYGEYEEPGVRHLLKRILGPDSIVIDSGANIGQMVLMYLRCGQANQIHAFEPTPAARLWLEDCLKINRLSHIKVTPLALGEEKRSTKLFVHDFNNKEGANNYLCDGTDALPIEMTTLDDYAQENGITKVRFWKLDTEGSELAALRGAASLLKQSVIDYLYVETANAGDAIADELAQSSYQAVPFALNRPLQRDEVNERFSNVFVSARIARDECGLTSTDGGRCATRFRS